AVTDPYLLTYTVMATKCNWGIEAGTGFDYSNIVDKNTPVSRETKINNFFYRIGICRKHSLGKRFEAGYGFDIVGDYQLSKTFSGSVLVVGNLTDSSESVATTRTRTIGAGLQASFGFYISDKIMLGTETTYYYTKARKKENVQVTDNITDPFNGNSS